MRILLLEPFFSGSHRQWAEGYQANSSHEIRILSLPGKNWKWRMFGGAVALAQDFAQMDFEPDLILATDMLDLTTFLALSRKRLSPIPVALYFHENQITYPWSPDDKDLQLDRNRQYGFINYTSALAADHIFFNSAFHQQAFLEALPLFLKPYPGRRGLHLVEGIQQKSQVLYLGMNLQELQQTKVEKPCPEAILLWNHRWEYDKDPEAFFTLLFRLKAENIPFRLIVVGESYQQEPPIFAQAKQELREQILHFGYAPSREAYRDLLWQADLLPVTSRQDFFGGSIVEAIYCNCYPLLPQRLAYPEHVPPPLHSDHFYTDSEDCYQRLKAIILDIDRVRQNDSYQNFVSQYDWCILAPHYDAQFRAIQGIHS